MKMLKSKGHTADFIFTLILFSVFAICALTLIIIGAGVYRQTAERMENNYTARTALSYITEKIRQHDTSGAVAAETIQDRSVLILTDEFDGQRYCTYIYEYDGMLKELMVKAETDLQLSAGQDILKVCQFAISEPQDGYFKYSVTDKNSRSSEASIKLRSTAS